MGHVHDAAGKEAVGEEADAASAADSVTVTSVASGLQDAAAQSANSPAQRVSGAATTLAPATRGAVRYGSSAASTHSLAADPSAAGGLHAKGKTQETVHGRGGSVGSSAASTHTLVPSAAAGVHALGAVQASVHGEGGEGTAM